MTMLSPVQATICSEIVFEGVGLHNGTPCRVTLLPAPTDHGLAFMQNNVLIPVTPHSVVSTTFCVKIQKDNQSIQTVEHLLSALIMMQVTNTLMIVEGGEIPILDGSAWVFAQEIQKTGIQWQSAPKKIAQITKKVEISVGDSRAIMSPMLDQKYSIVIDYTHPFFKEESLSYSFSAIANSFIEDIAKARTYGFLKDQEFYKKHGLAQGATLNTALIFGEDAPVNPEGERMPHEVVRHKILDVIGDLSFLGGPFLGHYQAYRPGHTLNIAMIRALLEQNALVWITVEELQSNIRSKVYSD